MSDTLTAVRESPRVSAAAHLRFLNPVKALARQDTIITGYRRLNGSLNGENVLSLCNYQDRSDYSEPIQFAKELGPHRYIGVDTDEEAIDHNDGIYPDLTWFHGDIVEAAEMFSDSALVNLDFTRMRDVFFRGNVRETKYVERRRSDVRKLIRTKPGVLPLVLDNLDKHSVVFVNVCTYGRGRDFTEDLPMFVDSLRNVTGWKPAGVLSGHSRNKALPSRGPWAKFYTYTSHISDTGTGTRGGVREFTTFCLVNR